jgi:MYXO-CTERM domain-containing protein
MSARMKVIASLFVAASVVAGCAEEKDKGSSTSEGSALLSELDTVAVDSTAKALAFSMASAPNVFLQSYLPVFTADLSIQLGDSCPTVVEDGAVTTYDGGCTDEDGQQWFGSATVNQSEDGSSLRYDAFGYMGTTSCGGQSFNTSSEWNGEMELEGALAPGGSEAGFETDLRMDLEGPDDACVATTRSIAYVYSGTMSPGPDGDGDSEPDAQIFDGSGEMGIDITVGDATLEGKVSADTVDEVVVTTLTSDTSFTLCQSEALSGTTTIEGGGQTTELLYDGDTDCDAGGTVMWTLDGASQGELAGVGCSVTRAAPGGRAFGAALLALALLAGRRARRR